MTFQFCSRVTSMVMHGLCCALLLGAVTLPAARAASFGTIPIDTPIPNDSPLLTVDEVNTIIGQAVGYLKSVNESGVISVVDREGHILAIFRMTRSGGTDFRINEQATVKARTAAFFQSDNNAFTTRTAQFIVQSNFPPNVRNLDAGPLFGVPLSNFPGSDVQLQRPPFIVFVNGLNTDGGAAQLPAGTGNSRPPLQPLIITALTDDFGGLPLYKVGADGKLHGAGGIGIEVDGFGMIGGARPDEGVKRTDQERSKAAIEEAAALSGQKGFAPPSGIRANRILINGFRFPYTAAKARRSTPVAPGALAAEGTFQPFFDTDGSERNAAGGQAGTIYPVVAGQAPATSGALARAVTLTGPRAAPAQEFPRRGFVPRFPPRDSPLGLITAADVRQIIQQGANRAIKTKAGIRNPKGAPEQVWICVVDTDGNICGSFRTEDATPFSFDVHVQKARTSAFFSTNSVGFSSRGVGFMAQTQYPPGIDKGPPGPLSGLFNPSEGVKPSALGTAFPNNAGRLDQISELVIDEAGPALPTDIASLPTVIQTLARRLPRVRDERLCALQVGITVDLTLREFTGGPATTIPNGITVFAGGVPLYKNGILAGGIGISGGGIDQDDFIAAGAAEGFEPPPGVRCDEASSDAIVGALQEAVTKLKTQFPNLTNGNDAVIDVVEKRLQGGGKVLQGLRIPYVKFPREPERK